MAPHRRRGCRDVRRQSGLRLIQDGALASGARNGPGARQVIDANDVPSLATFLDDGGNPGTFLGDMGFRALLYEWIEQMTAAPARRKHSAALTRRAAADSEVQSAANGTLAVVILVWMADVAENLALANAYWTTPTRWRPRGSPQKSKRGSTSGSTAVHAPGSAITFDTHLPTNNLTRSLRSKAGVSKR